jgi:hypothetical protein
MSVCNSTYITRESAGNREIKEHSGLLRQSLKELTDIPREMTGTRMVGIISE